MTLSSGAHLWDEVAVLGQVDVAADALRGHPTRRHKIYILQNYTTARDGAAAIEINSHGSGARPSDIPVGHSANSHG